MKTCARCKEERPTDDFSADRRARDGLDSWCRPCRREYAKARRDDNPTAHREAVRKWKAKPESAALMAQWVKESKARNPEKYRRILRRSEMKRRYGITPEEYISRLEEQGCCAICGSADPGGRGFHLDHDHETGELREFLCGACNMGLGQFGDNPDRLLAAAMYLLRHGRALEYLLPQLEG